MTANLNKATQDRRYLRSQVTKLYNSSLNLQDFDEVAANQELAKLKTLQPRLVALNEKIQDLMWDDSKADMNTIYEADLVSCEDYESKLLNAIVNFESKNNSKSNNFNSNGNSLKLKRPTAPLPIFDNESVISLTKFFIELEAIIDKFDYSPFERYIILRDQIKNQRALALLNSLEVKNHNYDSAKDLLIQALANPNLQKFEAINKLINLSCNSNKDLYVFVSEIKNIIEELDNSKVDRDCIVQYCILKAMPTNLRDNIVQISNTNYPTVKDILDTSFKAIERVKMNSLSQNKNFSGKSFVNVDKSTSFKNLSEKITTNAANVVSNDKKVFKNELLNNYDKKQECSLCKKFNLINNKNIDVLHSTSKCPKFSTVDDKLKFLKENKGCLKCSYFSHMQENCRFKFFRKCACNAYHMSYLCKKAERDSVNSPTNSSAQNTLSWTCNTLSNFSSFLPTFSCKLATGQVVRGVKDLGSQLSIFSQKLLSDDNYKIVQNNLKIAINGINEQKIYDTMLVNIKLKFGKKHFFVQGIVLPEIPIKLNISNFNLVVQGFKDKGYIFADKTLDESSSDESFQILLGTDNSYILPEKTVVFGQFNTSTYSETPYGIMLTGNSKNMERDIKYLKNLNKNKNIKNKLVSDNNSKNCEHFNGLVVNNFHVSAELTESFDMSILEKATTDMLDQHCTDILKYEQFSDPELNYEINDQVNDFLLRNVLQLEDGRLEMPLPWRGKVSHHLLKNYSLAKSILNLNLKKI